MQREDCFKPALPSYQTCNLHYETQEPKDLSAPATGNSVTSVLDLQQSPVDNSSFCSTQAICPAPVCRQFWKAGNYDDRLISKSILKNGRSYLNIHPKFLHSNATSHKWVFGAIAELLDNAIDETQNGATFVIVDKTSCQRDRSPALLIQDDGGGMNPEAMRHCLSFGFSDKKSKSAIGQYGNGFKTSTMRLGADVIVFSRCMKDRKLTQSVGLLSYTFLRQTGLDRIVVPLLDFEFDEGTSTWNTLNNAQHFVNNLSTLLRWSPCSTEVELFQQFDDIGNHGTKIIIFNLWHSTEGIMELDFDSDLEDICISGRVTNIENDGSRKAVSENHLANRLQYSLRAYMSILYWRIPENFCILLRGRVIDSHNIARDLKFPEFVVYRPQCVGKVEGSVTTSIGFLKEAPLVNISGFNVYHKNRLILPFWPVVNTSSSRGRGVVGVLEVDFLQPTHNKQDFEKTPLFQKLEARLKEMTFEYWDYHCGLIGYHVTKKPRSSMSSYTSFETEEHPGTYEPVLLNRGCAKAAVTKVLQVAGRTQHQVVDCVSNCVEAIEGTTAPFFQRNSQEGGHLKRKGHFHQEALENAREKADNSTNLTSTGTNNVIKPGTALSNEPQNKEAKNLMLENKKLCTRLQEYEKTEEGLNLKIERLKTELKNAQHEYANLLVDLRLVKKGIA